MIELGCVKLRGCGEDWTEVLRNHLNVNELSYVKVKRMVRRFDRSVERTYGSE